MLLCGFEGAALIMHSTDFPDYPPPQRQAIADRWFAVMFARFKRDSRMTYESPFTDEANKLCTKIVTSTGQLSFERILTDISGFFALFSKQRAQNYFGFGTQFSTGAIGTPGHWRRPASASGIA